MSTTVSWPGGSTNATVTSYSIPAAGEVNWSNLSNFLIALGNSAQSTTFQKFADRVATTSPVTVSVNDCIIITKLTIAGSVAISFPAGVDKFILWVADGTGDAQTNNITITPHGTDTIEGAATYVMAANGQAVGFVFNATNSNWKLFTNTHVAIGSIPLPSADIIVGNSSGLAQARAMSGDIAITNAGVTSIVATTNATLVTLSGLTTAGSLATVGTVTSGTWNATTVAVVHGGTGVTSVTTAPTASSFAGWDASSNLSANNHIDGYATTATAAAITTLTVASAKTQYFTGATTQTVLLPVASTLVVGFRFNITNSSSGVVTVQSSGANTVLAMAAGVTATFTCILASGTSAASWSVSSAASTPAAITALTGDVTASGPGSVAATLAATSNATLVTLSALTTAGSLVTVGTITSGTWSATTIAVNKGGTGLTSGTSGGILGYTASGTLASSGALTASQLIIGGGAGVTPSTLAAGSQYQVLVMGAANPGYGQVNLAQSAAITGTLPVGNGGTGVTSVTTSPTASSFSGWDANSNLSANSTIDGYATTATAGTTTTLTVASKYLQYFTGSTTQTVVLPVTSTLVLGQRFEIVNLSSGVVTVQSSGTISIQAMAANTRLIVTCILTSGTGTASWSSAYSLLSSPGTVTSVAMSVPAFLSISGSPITTSGTLAVSLSGTALPVANGGTAVTSVTTSPTASSFAGWDANKNLSGNSLITGYTTTATAGGTLTLVVGSTQTQYLTGSSNHTVVMPVTSTLVLGQTYRIINLSSGQITVNSSGSNLILLMAASTYMDLTCINTASTTAGGWDFGYHPNVSLGTVTSVAMTVPTFLSVSGSPITGGGTLAVTLSGTALPVANGGTGLTSGTSGGILGYTASGTLASSSALTVSQLIIGGGAGATPSTLAAGSQYQSLVMGATTPGYGQVNLAQSAAITGTLPVANGGTATTTPGTTWTPTVANNTGTTGLPTVDSAKYHLINGIAIVNCGFTYTMNTASTADFTFDLPAAITPTNNFASNVWGNGPASTVDDPLFISGLFFTKSGAKVIRVIVKYSAVSTAAQSIGGIMMFNISN